MTKRRIIVLIRIAIATAIVCAVALMIVSKSLDISVTFGCGKHIVGLQSMKGTGALEIGLLPDRYVKDYQGWRTESRRIEHTDRGLLMGATEWKEWRDPSMLERLGIGIYLDHTASIIEAAENGQMVAFLPYWVVIAGLLVVLVLGGICGSWRHGRIRNLLTRGFEVSRAVGGKMSSV